MCLSYLIKICLGIFLQLTICTSLETRPLRVLVENYEDDKNAMIAKVSSYAGSGDDMTKYEDFYDEFDNELVTDNSMDIIFFGPKSEFLRLDTHTILTLLTLTKKQDIPISRALLAWDLITDGKSAQHLQGSAFAAFDTLLNIVPEEDLYKINFGDISVMNYFANNIEKIEKHKLGALISAYRRYYGNSWINNSSLINHLGYLICGFPTTDLMKVTPNVFREIDVDIFNKMKFCSISQGEALFKIASESFGRPHSWTAHEIARLGFLFTFISADEIKSLKLHAMLGISRNVIFAMHQSKLEAFCTQQILRMNADARRAYILKTQLQYNKDVTGTSSASAIHNIIIINCLCLYNMNYDK